VSAQVIAGGPAERAGLRPGDAVLAVDGTPVAGLSPGRLAAMVRGEPGSTVHVRLDRPGADGPIELAIERAWLDIPPVAGRLLTVPLPRLDQHTREVDGWDTVQVGHVVLREFSRPAEEAMATTLDALHEAGATHWVLDLRGNRGGNLQTFVHLASMFIPEGVLAATVDRDGRETIIAAKGGRHRPYLQPLVVLVDQQSASAAELLAADLQEYGAGHLIGTTTAGCFGISRLFQLPDGAALWLTVSALQSGRDRRDVRQTGVAPDEVVTRTRGELAGGVDRPLDRALTWLASVDRLPQAVAAGGDAVPVGALSTAGP
jgi:carboxyl-terminal processing protease